MTVYLVRVKTCDDGCQETRAVFSSAGAADKCRADLAPLWTTDVVPVVVDEEPA